MVGADMHVVIASFLHPCFCGHADAAVLCRHWQRSCAPSGAWKASGQHSKVRHGLCNKFCHALQPPAPHLTLAVDPCSSGGASASSSQSTPGSAAASTLTPPSAAAPAPGDPMMASVCWQPLHACGHAQPLHAPAVRNTACCPLTTCPAFSSHTACAAASGHTPGLSTACASCSTAVWPA
jgi:hypothetical protein